MLNAVEVTTLLSKLCIRLGFCLPPDECARLKNAPPDSIDAFTNAVIVAEGLDPENMDLHLHRPVRAEVSEVFHKHNGR